MNSIEKKDQEGYTLIEVIITIFIMGIIIMMVNVVLISVVRSSYDVDTRMNVRKNVESSLEIMKRYTKSSDPSSIELMAWSQEDQTWLSCSGCASSNAIKFTISESGREVIFYLDQDGTLKSYWPGSGDVISLTSSYVVNIPESGFTVNIARDEDSDAAKVFVTIVADSTRERSEGEPIVDDFYKQMTIVTRGEELY